MNQVFLRGFKKAPAFLGKGGHMYVQVPELGQKTAEEAQQS